MSWVRTVPAALQTALDTRATTLCMGLLITPVSGAPFGLASLNRDVNYNDGDGSVKYVSRYGFDPSAVQFTAGTGVDNAEASVLFGVPDSLNAFGITEEMIDSGYLDDARYILYLLDWSNLTTGNHAEIESGKLGDIWKVRGAARVETRSRTQQLSQRVVCETGSVTCRATFGDATTGCGFDAAGSWISGAITGVTEVDRVFTDSALAQADGYFQPGHIEWLTGDNAGRTYEVEQFDSGGIITLAHPTYYDVQAGDTFQIRKQCPKTKAACVAFGQILNFRGEPDTPEADSRSNQTPKALKK